MPRILLHHFRRFHQFTKIFEIRGKKVMLDRNLAKLYKVKTKNLNKAITRNRKRFPDVFMYQLTRQEVAILKSQFATSSLRSQFVTLDEEKLSRGKYSKYLPHVFTEQGVAMLSSVLNSERAVSVNIMIMRAFVKLREILLTHKDLAIKLDTLERKYANHDEKIKAIFEAIRKLMQEPEKSKRRIGFHT